MNRDVFLRSLLDLITASTSSEGLLVATLGVMLRRMFGGPMWISLGFPSLKDALTQLEKQNLVRTGYDEKGAFRVWLSSTEPTISLSPATPPQASAPSEWRLRKEVWNAFVSERPQGLRFLRVPDGTITIGVGFPPGPQNEWKLIHPISRETQQTWGREFLQQKGMDGRQELLAALTSERWYAELPRILRTHDPSLCGAWNWYRSQKVIAEVEKWCAENAVPKEWVSQPQVSMERMLGDESRSYREFTEGFQRHRESSARREPAEATARLRAKILDALARMPTQDLLELRLPAKYLLDPYEGGAVSPGYPTSQLTA